MAQHNNHVKAWQHTKALLQADIMASRYLGDANEAAERGQQAKADRLYVKCQYWLDRYNKLSGNA